MINHSLRTYKCSFSYFLLLYMLQNKQSNRHSLHSVTSHVVLFAYRIMLNVSTRNRVTKTQPKTLYCEFKCSLQCSQENTGQNFVPKAF